MGRVRVDDSHTAVEVRVRLNRRLAEKLDRLCERASIGRADLLRVLLSITPERVGVRETEWGGLPVEGGD